jgi:hypothetical protein
MSRSADYTIQGFLYQFNKTLLEILKAQADSIITVEGNPQPHSQSVEVHKEWQEQWRDITFSDVIDRWRK